jgi:hypothetical protein
MTTGQPSRQFTCPACGHVTPDDPARCWRAMRIRRVGVWREARTIFFLVPCGGCGRREEIPAGPG